VPTYRKRQNGTALFFEPDERTPTVIKKKGGERDRAKKRKGLSRGKEHKNRSLGDRKNKRSGHDKKGMKGKKGTRVLAPGKWLAPVD